jgi:lipopolysaccharide export system protein LptA
MPYFIDAPNNFDHRVAHAVLAMIFAVILGTTAHGATAQSSAPSIPNAMQGFSQNRNQPIQIESNALEMRDKKKQATFSGNVKVMQGDTTMTSKALVVFYDASSPPANAKAAKSAPIQSATPGPGGSSSIRRLEARGGVLVVQKDQTVTGQTAIFDTRSNLITMAGGVVLTKCKNVIRGERLEVDMTTGVSRVESGDGKVHASVDQSSGAGCEAPSALPGASAPASKR